ncbi:AAA family ATPase [Variovorax sp. Sphag1AA]|uniref:AAA family ATPase n=1 Tax=Variovorax sp. Sphag1AA TaxID=2587027 RepID=UPI001617ABE9|nr:AAA family ATPase [Variovorax sp. Sphag1AA]MBB3177879.1 nicotinamide riboside kinase [Variovorax sp. Sphag1AA]
MTPALPVGCVIAVLGAPGTGKTELANALAARLLQRGVAAALVAAPALRSPTVQEHAQAAFEQTNRIAAAAQRGVVIADSTALMNAVEADIRFGDSSLYDHALAAHRSHAITLLMALDLPQAEGSDPAAQAEAERADALLRAALARAGSPFAVIHGRGPERLASAWNAINARAEDAGVSSSSGRTASGERAWFWPCDKCSDPACEHRLFRDLIAGRT